MSVHIESPYWVNWVLWHGVDRHRRTRRGFHGAVWDFVNRVRSLPAGSLTIDGGANAGAVTAAFAAQGLRVHSFEPDPFARGQLQHRFAGNPLVTIHPEALGVRAGSATLFRRPDFDLQPERASKSSTLLPDMLPAGGEAVAVNVVDLVAFIRGLNEPVAVLSLDVEGAEVEIIDRLIDEGLAERIGMIYAETHERFSPELAASTQRLRDRVAAQGLTNINLEWL